MMKLTPDRGIIGKPRRGGLIPMCWYCGSHTGHIVTQPDGTLLHGNCQGPARRDYPDRPVYEAKDADAKVCWNDQRDYEDGAGYWRA